MAESKIELLGRLRREGRWPGEAETFKNTALKEFKAKGVKNASDAAWEALGAAFPPLPAPPPEKPDESDTAVNEPPVAADEDPRPDIDVDEDLDEIEAVLDANTSRVDHLIYVLLAYCNRDRAATRAAVRERLESWADRYFDAENRESVTAEVLDKCEAHIAQFAKEFFPD